ncbi:MAG TPA: hypothetical protein VFO35_16230 [Steroidobacteraceae bacterium]|nr:hypothetical protein [Steroidobacteraceae bacterium]
MPRRRTRGSGRPAAIQLQAGLANHFGSSVFGTSITLSTGRPFSSAALRTAASLGPS